MKRVSIRCLNPYCGFAVSGPVKDARREAAHHALITDETWHRLRERTEAPVKKKKGASRG